MLIEICIFSIISGAVYSIIALGFAIIYQSVRFFHFAHGGVYAFGAYFVFLFYIQLGLNRLIAFPLACVAATLLGIALEIFIYKPMRKRKATDLTLLISSLGLYIVLQNIISLIWGNDTKSIRKGEIFVGHEFFGARITDIQIAIVITGSVLIIIMAVILKKTKFGKAIRGLANDPELASFCGINPDRYVLYAFAIGSFLAGVAATMISLDTDMTPTMGFNALTMGVVAVIIGGKRSLAGAAIGGLLLGFAQNFGAWQFSSKWQDAITFVILILFLLFRSNGISGKRHQSIHI